MMSNTPGDGYRPEADIAVAGSAALALPHQSFITLGDWLGSGHNEHLQFTYSASHSLTCQRSAYHNAVAMTGLRFHHNETMHDPNALCVGYQNNRVTAYHMAVLQLLSPRGAGKWTDHAPMGFTPRPIELAEMILWFNSLALPDFRYGALAEKSPLASHPNHADAIFMHSLNGFWHADLDVTFGYGLFDLDPDHLRPQHPPLPCLPPPRRTAQPATEGHCLVLDDVTAAHYGRIVLECPYDVRLSAAQQHTCHPHVEPYRSILAGMAGQVVQAGARFWFERKVDAALFRLF